MRFVRNGAGLRGGGTGLFVMVPGFGEVAEIEGLPSGEGLHFGEQSGEGFSGAGGEAVGREAFDLTDFGFEFVADDECAELAVESADGVELLVEQGDGRVVDAAGGGEELAQFGG